MRSLVLALLCALAACATMNRLAAVDAEAWARWEAHDPTSRRTVDHAAWDAFLAKYLRPGRDGIARLAYSEVDEADKAALTAYVASLAAVPVSSLARPEQFAFWVNLHNALVVRTVLEHEPVSDIRDIGLSRGIVARGPFHAKLVNVEGEAVSLDDISRRILRPLWRDPRVHYALCLGAVGGPNLQSRAFTAANAPDLMAAGGRDFVNHPRGVRMRGGTAEVSSLYFLYQADFGGGERGVVAHLRRFARPELGARLARLDDLRDRGFDWTLNEAAFAPAEPSQ